MSLAVKPSKVEAPYRIIACFFGIYMMSSLIFTIIFLVQSTYQVEVFYAILSTFCIFTLVVLVTCSTVTVLKGIVHYLFLTPTYVNIFLIYSICNTHDCSWGNRPDLLTQEEKNRTEEFEEFRIRWVIVWVLCNSSFAYFMNALGNIENGQWYIYGIGLFGMSIMMFRFLGAVFYIFHEACCKRKIKNVKGIMPVIEDTQKTKTRNPDQIVTQAYVLLNECPKDDFMKRRKKSASEDLQKMTKSQDMIKEGVKITELNMVSEHVMTEISEERAPGIMSLSSSRRSKKQSLSHIVDDVLGEKTEEISELSLVMRQKRFQKGIRLTQMAKDLGVPASRLRGIEEGIMIPTNEERKMISSYIINSGIDT